MSTLHIVIVGAGIAGLAAAISISQKAKHDILICESNPTLTTTGAGIHITSSASRLLCNWGLREKFEDIATVPDYMDVRRYGDDRLIGLVPSNIRGHAERVWGFPHWLVHRIDYRKILADAATAEGVKIQFGQKVVAIDAEEGRPTLEDGKILTADLIIGADGIHSRTRRSLSAVKDVVPHRASCYCYRALIPRERMLSNPLTAALMTNENQLTWMGPFKHIVAYPVAAGSLYNITIVISDDSDAPIGLYDEPGDVMQMRNDIKDWNEAVTTMLDMIDSCAKWTIADLPPLPTWTSPNGRVILLGDACHAMAPHAASGAATGVEDAEILGHFLVQCKDVRDLARAARSYQDLRQGRCERIQEVSRQNANTFSIPDGPEQQARDRMLQYGKEALEEQLAEDIPWTIPQPDATKPFPHPDFLMWLCGYDAAKEAKTQLRMNRINPVAGTEVRLAT
ncbi:uncharacterized protein Z518_02818 [Rhinocladiella mackenziei CBS 650.93]|uniref:FAD-binding domain-containing protein n=1 Tax=Rhinocladiella mackenziei CBS 650.93 TaxID=1442369 RepID=A0A0D2G0W4_9EURO|nr:uncharacterized protein Z518_02818 [Rhinocladiella mackenziei CBS 650.93]KIX08162.1 hypothetical protein Z518_02818 [Rhinocladiella mackenziei CBS 650.93]